MHDIRWQHWLDEFAIDYFVAVFRPELPAEERLRAAGAAAQGLDALQRGGPGARRYLRGELGHADTQRRNAAARVLSAVGDAQDMQALLASYLDPERPWLSPGHLVRGARRHPLDPELRRVIADAPLRMQSAWVRALLAHQDPEAQSLLARLVVGPDPSLAQAAVEAAADWQDQDVLWAIILRVDGTDDHPDALVPAGIEAAFQLAVGGQRRGIDWLEERTLDQHALIGGQAHVALASLGWSGCLAELAELLETESGTALGFALEAADLLGSAALVPSLCDVVRRTVDQSGSGIDDNPADHAIRVLESVTGRWVSASLCSYDGFGNLDHATRQRAALLHATAASGFDPGRRYRAGQPLRLRNWVDDLLSPAPRRARSAARQLGMRPGGQPPIQVREDLLGNLRAVQSWRGVVGRARRTGPIIDSGLTSLPPPAK